MTLEQRLEAVEKALSDLTLQQGTTEELSGLIRKITIETIRKSQRPGGLLSKHKEKADISHAALEVGSVHFSPSKKNAMEVRDKTGDIRLILQQL